MNSRRVAIVVLSMLVACSAQSSTAPAVAVVPREAPSSSAAKPQADVIAEGRLIHKEDPKYPKEARKQKIEGQVVLEVTVDENGRIGRAAGISGDPQLIGAAEEAVFKWRFEPFTQQGHAISVQQNLIFNFDLNRKLAELELPLPQPKPLSSPAVSNLPLRLRIGNSPRPEAASATYRVGGGVSAPRVLVSQDPEYSDEARKAKYEGTSRLALVVGSDGLPRDIKVVRPLGMGLDEKAIEAVKQWRFQPAMKDGKPVAVAIAIELQFHL